MTRLSLEQSETSVVKSLQRFAEKRNLLPVNN